MDGTFLFASVLDHDQRHLGFSFSYLENARLRTTYLVCGKSLEVIGGLLLS